MTDTTDIGRVAADLMEAIALIYPDAEVGDVCVVAEIKVAGGSVIRIACTDDRDWVQAGLLRRGQMAAERGHAD